MVDFKKIDFSSVGKPITGTPFRVEDPIGDKWQVLNLLGKGGMGVVYLALEKESGDVVAVKTMRMNIPITVESKNRFYEGALSWVKIGRHLHILEEIGSGHGECLVIKDVC